MGRQYHYIAVDLGAESGRVMLASLSGEKLSLEEMHRFANGPVKEDGTLRWDVDRLFAEIKEGIKKALALEEDIQSIGVDTWGVDFGLIDSNGQLLEKPYHYRDARTIGVLDKASETLSRRDIYQNTGIQFLPFNTLFQLIAYKQQKAEILQKASSLLFMPNLFMYLLCGDISAEYTIASTSQLMNMKTGTWSDVILDAFGIPKDILPKITTPGTKVAVLEKRVADEMGCSRIPVIAVGTHDTASAVVSVPFVDESSVFISTGTWCIVGIESDNPILTEEALKEGFTNERGYGDTFRCLKNIVGLWLVQGLMKSLPVGDDYSEIEAMALGYDGDMSLINPGDPVFFNPDNMKETFDEYFKRTRQKIPGSPGGYFRAAYNSLIFSFRRHIELIEKMTGRPVSTIHLMGGGCQSNYLTSQTAAICNRKVVSGPVEAATIGNILVQAIAMNKIHDIREARELVGRTMAIESIDPPAETSTKDSDYQKFLDLIG